MRYWRRRSYWRWLWDNRISPETKLACFVLVAVALGIAGYVSARKLDTSVRAAPLTTERVVTIVHRVSAKNPGKGKPRFVTRLERVTLPASTVTTPGRTNVVTVRRNGRTLVITQPQKTQTVAVPGKSIVRTETRNSVRTVTSPARTVTSPGATVTGPGSTVTAPGAPGSTVTVTSGGSTRTITQTATQEKTVTETATSTATETVTLPVTETVTDTVTETATVTETVTETSRGK